MPAAASVSIQPVPSIQPPLTSRQKALIRESYKRFEPALDLVATLFYLRLFDLDPSLRSAFPGLVKAHTHKFADLIRLSVISLDHPERLAPTLKLLGARNRSYGLKRRDYVTISRAMIWTLEQSLEARFTRETKQAWTGLLAQITEGMAG